jgi:protein-disulfide isomerase
MTKNRLLAALILLVGLGLGCASSEAPLSSRTTRNADGTTTIDIAGMPVQGADNTRVAVIEFSDYDCPYCARHATTVFPELKDRFIATGKVRYVFANFPLPNHPNAKPLAAAAICAGNQDAYWKMHDELFENRPRTTEAVLDIGRQLGLQMEPFGKCLGDDGPQVERIRIDQQIAQEFQISGTPSFVLGVFDDHGRVVARDIIVGAHPFPRFESAITKLLN